VEGVTRCVVGYTGGVQDEPTYKHICDYTEALLVEFDPLTVSYKDILKEWWSMATPYPSNLQYRTAVWYLNEEQKEEIHEVLGPNVKNVDVEPATQFFMAEEYHQNFINKQKTMIR
jgi:peptide methionine sulfoxide reductase MsrA